MKDGISAHTTRTREKNSSHQQTNASDPCFWHWDPMGLCMWPTCIAALFNMAHMLHPIFANKLLRESLFFRLTAEGYGEYLPKNGNALPSPACQPPQMHSS